MNTCAQCEATLTGRQTKFCSKICKNKDSNHIHQNYKNQKRRGLERKIKLISMKGGKCKKCSYDANIAALCFHHLYDKSFELDIRKCSNSTWDALVEEADKCELLCANCHAEVHNPDGGYIKW